MSTTSVGIVGGGILGLAIGRELLNRYPGISVVLFEKEDQLAKHQTGNNSGVIHAGIYYKPGSLKAELCTRGRDLLYEFCDEHAMPYRQCGKLVVAVDESELGRLDALEKSATANNVPGLRRIESEEITDIEPNSSGLVALHSPETGITDYTAISLALGKEIEAGGGRILLSSAVTDINASGDSIEVITESGTERVDRLVLCAGLQSDRVAKLVGGDAEPRILPFRGEYMNVTADKQEMVRGMIYPVPDPQYPFLGVHFTRRVSGELEVGPNALLALKREGYRKRDVSLADMGSIASWPGFWRMARTHWRTGMKEMRGSLSVRSYMKVASQYVPDIGAKDVVRGGAGVRAQAIDRDGSLVDDFRIVQSNGVVSVRNAPSPAATSSLAIAEYVVDRIDID